MELGMIFLSYAREDAERANRIYSLLNKHDRPIFYDKESLLPGMNWQSVIEEKLSLCSLILILCSKNSIIKEGFVQKEILLALERAENMPEGKIFIIPIRFDEVSVPKKLTKYQWININTDVDYYDLQFFIDCMNGIHRSSNTKVDNKKNNTDNFNVGLREKVVILIQGKNTYQEQIYTYLQLPLWKLHELKNCMNGGESFHPQDFGEILSAGLGNPPEELRQQMAITYNLIDMSKQRANISDEEQIVYQQYLIGFTDGFKSVLGDDVDVPLLGYPHAIPSGTTPLREGIRHGLRSAQSRINDIAGK